jgi:hypothetical protein
MADEIRNNETEISEEDFSRSMKDTIQLFSMSWNFLLEFDENLCVPVSPEIEKFSTTLSDDIKFFPNKFLYKDCSHLRYGWSPNNLVCKYELKEISIFYHALESLKNFTKAFPDYSNEQLSQKNSPERNRLMRYIIFELKKIMDGKSKDEKTNLLLMSDIITPVADFLGFDCLMNLCDYVYNNSSWVPCIYEQVKYGTRLFIIEKLDNTVPNLRKMFNNSTLKSENDLYDKVLPVLRKLPDRWRIPAFLKYACQMLVDPVISPKDSQLSDSCGIPYYCKTLGGETLIVDKLWLNPYQYRQKFYKVNTMISPNHIRNTIMSEYRYTTEENDDSEIDFLDLTNK